MRVELAAPADRVFRQRPGWGRGASCCHGRTRESRDHEEDGRVHYVGLANLNAGQRVSTPTDGTVRSPPPADRVAAARQVHASSYPVLRDEYPTLLHEN